MCIRVYINASLVVVVLFCDDFFFHSRWWWGKDEGGRSARSLSLLSLSGGCGFFDRQADPEEKRDAKKEKRNKRGEKETERESRHILTGYIIEKVYTRMWDLSLFFRGVTDPCGKKASFRATFLCKNQFSISLLPYEQKIKESIKKKRRKGNALRKTTGPRKGRESVWKEHKKKKGQRARLVSGLPEGLVDKRFRRTTE